MGLYRYFSEWDNDIKARNLYLNKHYIFWHVYQITILIFATIYSWHVSINFFDYTRNKKGWGATWNLKLAEFFTKERFPIIWKKGRPVEKYFTVFKSKCIALVRWISIVSLKVKDWREVPYQNKRKLFNYIFVHYIKVFWNKSLLYNEKMWSLLVFIF